MSDLDISDDVLNFFENLDKPEPETEVEAEAVETEVDAPAETEVVADETVDPVATDEVDDEVDTEPVVDLHPEEIKRREYQAVKDRELAAMQSQMEQLQTALQQQHEYSQQIYQQQIAAQQAQQQQAQQENLNVSPEMLEQGVESDLKSTFQWIANKRPDLLPNLVSMVRGKEQYGHQVADQMMFEFQQFQSQRQYQELEARQTQQYQEITAPAQVEATMGQIINSLEGRFGETFSAMSDEIAVSAAERAEDFKNYMQQNGRQIGPNDVAEYVTQIYFDLRDQKLNQDVNKPRGPQELKPTQHVENSSAVRQVDTTSDEDAMNEILKGAQGLGIDVSAASL